MRPAGTWLVALMLATCGLAGAAAAHGNPLGAFGGDADQPIEINADSLEVQQDQQVAIFRGNVDAVQGQIRLRADEIKVHYRSNPEGNDQTDGTIVRIDAIGNVFVSSPT